MMARTLIVISNAARRNAARARLQSISGATELREASNLTEAYHDAEHRPPGLVVFSEDLTFLPEFEVILALMTALNARVSVLCRSEDAKVSTVAVNANGITIAHEKMADADLRAALKMDVLRSASQRPVTPENTALASEPGRVILIGSSTGGVEALINVLGTFPQDCPPTFLVQHTGGSFSAGLARLLNSKARIKVCEAENGMMVQPGTAVLAPGDRFHLTLKMRGTSAICEFLDEPVQGGHRPAVDVLFHSAVPYAPQVTAALLTGMGRDGASGLLALKEAGARTLGQDEETSLVYGMPRAAAEMGAVQRQLSIDRIGPALIAAASERIAT